MEHRDCVKNHDSSVGLYNNALFHLLLTLCSTNFSGIIYGLLRFGLYTVNRSVLMRLKNSGKKGDVKISTVLDFYNISISFS